MSSAYLASSRARVPHPDVVRIAALSAAMAINLTVFLAATRPLPPLLMPQPATADLGVRFIPPKVKPAPPPPPPPTVQPLRQRPSALPATSRVAPPAHLSEEGRQAAPPVTTPTLAPPSMNVAPSTVPGPPVEASLAYRNAPLAFPIAAIRQHMHGTVVLRVLVDERGTPLDVIVETSSGYPLLDRSAREQVLAGWRFQPASVDGRAMRAWARVPVRFELRSR